LNNKIKPSLFTSKDTKMLSKVLKLRFTDPECLLEGKYNESFKFIEDERKWVQIMMGLHNKYEMENSCIQKQLKNLSEVYADSFSKRETEIFNFNIGRENTIAKPVLFQSNFIANNTKSDYQIFKDYQANTNEYVSGKKTFQPFHDRLRLLKCLIIAKRKPTKERSMKITKALEK
ncbi:uncharacterized protein VICG_02243, partial [Vittaforma corneae ATCC 50505]